MTGKEASIMLQFLFNAKNDSLKNKTYHSEPYLSTAMILVIVSKSKIIIKYYPVRGPKGLLKVLSRISYSTCEQVGFSDFFLMLYGNVLMNIYNDNCNKGNNCEM